MKEKNQVFLGKAGKIYGPYPQDEFEKLFAEGKLGQYTWIWDWKSLAWKPIEVPPPSPIESLSEKSDSAHTNWNLVEALCFDRFSLISGKLEWVTESGCVLVAQSSSIENPFPIHGVVELNLYDSKLNKTTSTQVSIADRSYENQTCVYRLKWKEIPKF